MAGQLNEHAQRLLKGKNFANVATLRKDGSPQVTPVWVDFDGTHIILNSEQKRAKVKNLKRDPRVTISVFDHDDPALDLDIRVRVPSRSRPREGPRASTRWRRSTSAVKSTRGTSPMTCGS